MNNCCKFLFQSILLLKIDLLKILYIIKYNKNYLLYLIMVDSVKILKSLKKVNRKADFFDVLINSLDDLLVFGELMYENVHLKYNEESGQRVLSEVSAVLAKGVLLKLKFNFELSSKDKDLIESLCLTFWEKLTVIEKLKKSSYKGWHEAADKTGKKIIDNSPAMQECLEKVRMVAPHDTTVLLQGETGTGKEVIARFIHNISSRRNQSFIVVNCAALPESLIDSSLFGHVKGAFTGADSNRAGFFEKADGGTVFLDEIGDLPLETQTRLLRIIEYGDFNPVGSDFSKKVNVRVIAASHISLKEAVLQEKFRKDLFYRLTVFPVYIPPLRQRKEDIPELIDELIQELSRKLKIRPKETSQNFYLKALEYNWPGNVRELRNTLEKSLILSSGKKLQLKIDDSQFFFKESMGTFDEEVRKVIECALIKCSGQVSGKGGAAELLDLNPQTMYSKMRKYGIGSQLRK